MKKTSQKSTQNANHIINDALQAIDILRELYVRENDALSRAHARDFMSLQAEKEVPLNYYKDRIETLMMHRDEARKVDPTLKQKLQSKQAEFAALCEENLKGLKKMQRGTERLSNKIRFCAQESARQKGRYSYGETGRVNHTALDQPLSIGVSEEA